MKTQELKDRIQQACRDTEVEFRSDYSGRCMYGKRCIGMVGSIGDCNQIISDLVKEMMQELFSTAIDSSDDDINVAYDLNDELQDQVDDLLNYRMDNMGLEVILYWPQIEGWKDDRPIEEDEE